VSPVYFSNGTTCRIFPSQQGDICTTTEASFGIDSKQEDVKGSLLYKLQRKHTTNTDNQPNSNSVSTENTTTNIYLLVVWNAISVQHSFYTCLIECNDDNFTWDEDKLWALYREYDDQFYKDYKSNTITWSMHDGTVMKTRVSLTYGPNYKLDIDISEGTVNYEIKEPMQIDPKRLVLS
jgi:hypothetical protein